MTEPKSPSRSQSGETTANRSSPGAASAGPGGDVKPASLKLLALDDDDLTVVAMHLQDAVVRVRDMAFVPKNRRFALILNRFDWSTAGAPPAATEAPARQAQHYERRRCAVRFEHVRAARTSGFSQRDTRQVLSLLTITFQRAREGEPDGTVTLLFAGGAAIRLEVECIEAELRDLATGWRTAAKPEHPES